MIHLTDKGAILHGLHLVLGKGAFTWCAQRGRERERRNRKQIKTKIKQKSKGKKQKLVQYYQLLLRIYL